MPRTVSACTRDDVGFSSPRTQSKNKETLNPVSNHKHSLDLSRTTPSSRCVACSGHWKIPHIQHFLPFLGLTSILLQSGAVRSVTERASLRLRHITTRFFVDAVKAHFLSQSLGKVAATQKQPYRTASHECVRSSLVTIASHLPFLVASTPFPVADHLHEILSAASQNSPYRLSLETTTFSNEFCATQLSLEELAIRTRAILTPCRRYPGLFTEAEKRKNGFELVSRFYELNGLVTEDSGHYSQQYFVHTHTLKAVGTKSVRRWWWWVCSTAYTRSTRSSSTCSQQERRRGRLVRM